MRRARLVVYFWCISKTKNNKRKEQKMSTWKIDLVHSEVNFKVKHMIVSTVTGHFGNFEALIEANKEDFSDAKFDFEADTISVNTKNEMRDGHLKSPDFFDAEKFPKMSFVSNTVKKTSEHELEVTGDLTIKNVTKKVKLDVIYNGTVAGNGGSQIAGFEIRTKINRFDYGLKWNGLTETGGVMVSNEVKIEILAEFNKVNEAAKAA